MGMMRSVSADGKLVTIKINGRFDYSAHQDFRAVYESNAAKAANYILDLANTEFMDSAACGMLLVFRDAVGGNAANISIVNANPDISHTLSMLQFHKMFKIV